MPREDTMDGRDNDARERRRFPRLKRPVLFRSPSFFDRFGRAEDVSEGGFRIYCQTRVEVGALLEIEVGLPEGDVIAARAKVVWVARLPEGAPAPWDVGLQFVALAPESAQRLARHLAGDA